MNKNNNNNNNYYYYYYYYCYNIVSTLLYMLTVSFFLGLNSIFLF